MATAAPTTTWHFHYNGVLNIERVLRQQQRQGHHPPASTTSTTSTILTQLLRDKAPAQIVLPVGHPHAARTTLGKRVVSRRALLTASSQRSRERTESSTDDKLDSVGDDSTARPEQGGSIHDANASTDGVDDDGDGDGDSEMSSDAVPTDNPRLVIVPPVDLHMNTAVAEDVISAYRWYMLFFTVDTVLLVYLTCVSQILTGNNALLIAHIVSILAYIVGVFGSLTGNTLLLTIGTVAASVQSGYFIILAFHPIQLLHGLCAALLCWSARRLARELDHQWFLTVSE